MPTATARYERLAAAFLADTGMLAPGKDDVTNAHPYETRLAAWRAWLDEGGAPGGPTRSVDALVAVRVLGLPAAGAAPYSTDDAAAAPVLAALGADVAITNPSAGEWYVTAGGRTFWAETRPLAICRAALALARLDALAASAA